MSPSWAADRQDSPPPSGFRALHKVAVIDSGDPRNWKTRGINGIIGSQGIRSPELREHGRRDAESLGAELIDDLVTTISNTNSERFELAGPHCESPLTTITRPRCSRDCWPHSSGECMRNGTRARWSTMRCTLITDLVPRCGRRRGRWVWRGHRDRTESQVASDVSSHTRCKEGNQQQRRR